MDILNTVESVQHVALAFPPLLAVAALLGGAGLVGVEVVDDISAARKAEAEARQEASISERAEEDVQIAKASTRATIAAGIAAIGVTAFLTNRGILK